MLSEVPEGWSLQRFGEIASVKNGFAFKSKDFVDSQSGVAAVVRMSDLKKGTVEASLAKKIPLVCLEGLERFRLEAGDFVFGMSGSLSNYAVVPASSVPLYLNQRVGKLEAKSTDAVFLRYLYTSESFMRLVEKSASGNAQLNISSKQIESFEVLVPPANEQRRIAEVLSSVDASVQATQAVIEQAERVKRGLMEELLTGGLGSEAIERGEVPDGWATLSLQSIADFITKGATPTTYGYGWESTGIPFFRSECVSERGFTRSGMAFISSEAHEALSRSVVNAGDLLISITGNVGRVAVVPESLQEGNINQHIARVRINSSEAEKKFIYYALSSPAQRRLFESIVTGQAYPQLSLKQIRETQVVVPPLCEQRRVIQILSSIDEFIAGQERIIGQQNRTKRGLMDDLLTGKVRAV